jgi:ATP-dependent phosphofructokinase / diphosphate-dependent phosphofructokinase
MTTKKGILYLQSGGPTAVINSSLFGVIEEAKKHPEISVIAGARFGMDGVFKKDFVDLRKEDPAELKLLLQTPGAVLGSCRRKLPEDENDPVFATVLSTLHEKAIGTVLINGGNDSMDAVAKLASFFKRSHEDIRVIGIPKTIDNDLALTDHCPGYASAALHVMNLVSMVVVDSKAYTNGKVILVEIMGRNAGWLTASADLLPTDERPDLIYLPETAFDEERFLNRVQEIYAKKHCVVVVLSEGVNVPRQKDGMKDAFGHPVLEGISSYLGNQIMSRLNIGVHAMQLSLPQRADPAFVSKVDRKEAIECGRRAVRFALAGKTGQMVALKRITSRPYRVSYVLVPAAEIANQEKRVPTAWIVDDTKMSSAFRTYLAPLVSDIVPIRFEKGIFCITHLRLKKLL